METTVKSVKAKHWRHCPCCGSEYVQAVKNGLYVGKKQIPTDLMICTKKLGAEHLYIVWPDNRPAEADVKIILDEKIQAHIFEIKEGAINSRKFLAEIEKFDGDASIRPGCGLKLGYGKEESHKLLVEQAGSGVLSVRRYEP